MEQNTGNNEIEEQTAQGDAKERSAGALAKKIASIALDVLLYVFLAFSVFVLIVSLVSKKSNGAANLFGHEMRIVVSSSMEHGANSEDTSAYKIKEIKLRSLVFIERVPEDEEEAKQWYSELEVGDVLTFSYVVALSQETITHRITKITPTETGYILELKGDNRTGDAEVSTQTLYTSSADFPNGYANYNYVIGKVTGQSVVLGHILYGVSRPLGMALIIIVPCSIIIIWQVVRVALVFGEERKKKTVLQLKEAERAAAAESEEREKQARELEELKKRLSELESKTVQSDAEGSKPDGETDA